MCVSRWGKSAEMGTMKNIQMEVQGENTCYQRKSIFLLSFAD
jgi:hypothetical protein